MIRMLTVADAPAYRTLRLLSLETDPLAFLTDLTTENWHADSYYADQIRYNFKPPCFGIYGQFANDQRLIATVQFSPAYHSKQKHLGFLYSLYVHPDFRRQHLAEQLLTYLINQAKTMNLEQIHLAVNSRNTSAQALYKKLGFIQIASRPNMIKEPDNSYQDELLFRLVLH